MIDSGPHPPLFEFVTQNWMKPTNPHNKPGGTDDANIHNYKVHKTETAAVVPTATMIPGTKIAIIDGSTGMSRTFHDYYVTATGLAGLLQKEMNVTMGTTVALYCPNHVDYLPVCLGIALCGAKVTPINPLYTLNEYVMVLNKSHATVVVTHVSKIDITIQAVLQCPSIQNIIIIPDDEEQQDHHPSSSSSSSSSTDTYKAPIRIVNLKSVQQQYIQPIHQSVMELQNDKQAIYNTPYCLPYSSGTTGLPKGVCLSHANVISNLLQLHLVEKDGFLIDHKLISPLPFFHIYAFTLSLLFPAWTGNTLITMSQRFDLETFCSLVQEHQPERAHLVPPILVGLEKNPIVDLYKLSSLRSIVSAAAPLSSNTETVVQTRISGNANANTTTPITTVKQGWGMSELSPIGTMNTDQHNRTGSVGPLVSSTEGKIICTETGRSLGPNEHGELLIRGPQVMMGYYMEPNTTKECLSPESGWLRTGDIATYDEDGYFYIQDRMKELIKVNGYQVAPAELESLLLQNESITDVAVIGIPHDESGEVPRAYIVLKQNETTATTTTTSNPAKFAIDTNAIYDWVKERVAPYKRLNGGIVVIDTIPKSASGKILRRLLKDQYKLEQEQKKQKEQHQQQQPS